MVQKFFHGLLILSGVGLVVFLIGKLMKSNPGGRVANVPTPVQKAFNKIFDSSPYQSLKDNWLAVSKMETAGWNSKLFTNSLNLWGMKKPKVRPTTAQGKTFGITGRETISKLFPNITEAANIATGQSEWAKYDSIEDAVKDIILWMDYTKFPKGPLSLRNHIEEMKKRSYFQEDVDYYLKAVAAWEAR
jgi:hypothetical protein